MLILAQTAAVLIFVVMFLLIILEKFEKHHTTMACGIIALVLVFGLILNDGNSIIEILNLQSVFTRGL